MITIWIIGILFSVGLAIAKDYTVPVEWYYLVLIGFLILIAWPLLLGLVVGELLNENGFRKPRKGSENV